MRTLHLNDQYGWRGGEQQVLTLLEGLEARGHRTTLVAQPYSEMATRAADAGVEVVTVATHGELAPRAVPALRRLVRERAPKVVHAHTAHSHMHAVLACLGNPGPKVVVSRRVDFSIHKAPLRLALVKYHTRVDRIVAISEAVKRVLVADGVDAARIGVVHSGLDPARADGVQPADLTAEFGIAPDAPVVVTVAALVGHKGHRFLVDAAPRVLDAMPAVRFLFVGDGPLAPELRAQADRLGVADAILFAGFRRDFLSLMAAGDAYVMPSHLEGLNTSVIDAMFLQRPIVVTDAGGLPELIDDGATGRVVPAEAPHALADAVIELLQNRDRAAAFGRAARARAIEAFTADRMVEGMLAEYARVLGGEAAPA